eukprot:scaffold20931_cov37-Tisochrysis_lutea.AAC.2
MQRMEGNEHFLSEDEVTSLKGSVHLTTVRCATISGHSVPMRMDRMRTTSEESNTVDQQSSPWRATQRPHTGVRPHTAQEIS